MGMRAFRTSFMAVMSVVTIWIFSTTTLWAAPGDLDMTFGTNGTVTTNIGGTDRIKSSLIQNDGKMVAVGYSHNGSDFDFALARYNTDGSPDSTFGTNGIVTTDIGGDTDYLFEVVIQGDGKIVVSGQTYNMGPSDFAVARYNINGSLDSTFGVNGIVITDTGSNTERNEAIGIQSDGKIITGGYSWNGSDRDFTLVRYDTNGSLDTTFGTNGVITTDIGGNDDIGHSIAIQNDGKIVLAGYSFNGTEVIALARYNANGSLDTSFDTDGIVTTNIGGNNDRSYGVTIQSDGKILVAGYSNNGSDLDFAMARYNTNGSLDSAFGTNGIVTTDIGGNDDRSESVAIQTNGKIVISGYSDNGSNTDFAIARYNSDGSPDSTFGVNGIVVTDLGGFHDRSEFVMIQNDGKIVATGYSNNGSDDDFALSRYGGDQFLTGVSIPLMDEKGTALFILAFVFAGSWILRRRKAV